MRVGVVVAVVTIAAGAAFADRLVLHSQDSITIEGTRYTCDDASRKGVQLAPGDHINAGGYQLHCEGDRGGTQSAPPPPPPKPTGKPIVVHTHVDRDCIGDLFKTTNGRATASDAVHFAEGCRPFDVDGQCTATATQPDADCFASLNYTITGSLADQDVVRIQRACQRIDASCPAYANKITSKVDPDCVSKVSAANTAKPTSRAIASWLESCRDHAVGSCVVVGGKLDHDCVTKAYSMFTGSFSASDAATVSRACRVLELRCQ